jgi:uncharacterized membrane protein
METPVETSAPETRAGTGLTVGLLGVVVLVGIVFAFSSSVLLPNNWYSLFKAIHVTFAVLWVGGGLLLTILALVAERRSDPTEITLVARQAAFVGERIFAPAGLIVFAMGIAMMINTNFGWGKFWVIVGLVGYATTFVTGIAVLSPLTKEIAASAAEHGPTAPETMALIKKTLLIVRFDVALLLIVVLDMVTKPFS